LEKRPEAEREWLLAWVGARVLPHEAAVRNWLVRFLSDPADVDDVIQEAYCRIWAAKSLEMVGNARAYFFQTARNIVIDNIRRSKVVKIESVAEIEEAMVEVDEVTPEQVLSARAELRRVQRLMELLPPRCRQIFAMRKIEGLSQREIAEKMNVTEHIVENEIGRGLRLILQAIETMDNGAAPQAVTRSGWRRGRSQNR
jgi:RNA polymerase sigma-70 factor (ECF subfamily)